MRLESTTIEKSPEFQSRNKCHIFLTWPRFLHHASSNYWDLLIERFSAYQILMMHETALVGVGYTVPLFWNHRISSLPDSIEETLIYAIGCREINKPANTLAVLGVMGSEAYQDNTTIEEILFAAKSLAKAQGMKSLIVHVRPAHKSRFPLTSLEEYISWRQPDGSPFDPWIRLYWKAGASVMKTAPKSLTVKASIDDWERWVGMRFKASGEYIVDGALRPVLIDSTENYGWYQDPHLWMHLNLDTTIADHQQLGGL